MNTIKTFKVKVITSGDVCQLPPVRDIVHLPNGDRVERRISPFYELHPIHIELTKNVRNDNPLYNKLLTLIRETILYERYDKGKKNEINRLMMELLDGYSSNINMYRENWSSHRKVLDTVSKFCKELEVNDDQVLLAHRTNDKLNVVNILNNLIREVKFNNPKEMFVIGELIQFTSFHVYKDNDTKRVYYTCDKATVIEIDIVKKKFYSRSFTCYKLTLKDKSILHYPVESDIKSFKQYSYEVKKELQSYCLDVKLQESRNKIWNEYYTMYKDTIAPIEYRYSLSIHKSQGSSFKYAYIFLSDFVWMSGKNNDQLIENYYKLLYVALSRSKTNSIVF